MNLNHVNNIGIRADMIRDKFSFIGFWEAIGKDKLVHEISKLYDKFLYLPSDAITPSEHFEYFMRYHCTD